MKKTDDTIREQTPGGDEYMDKWSALAALTDLKEIWMILSVLYRDRTRFGEKDFDAACRILLPKLLA